MKLQYHIIVPWLDGNYKMEFTAQEAVKVVNTLWGAKVNIFAIYHEINIKAKHF